MHTLNNPSTTPSGRKVTGSEGVERRKTEKMLHSACNAQVQRTYVTQTKIQLKLKEIDWNFKLRRISMAW